MSTQLGGDGLPPGVVINYDDPPNNAWYVPIVGSVLLSVTGIVVIINLALTAWRKFTLDKVFLGVALGWSIAHVTIANIEILKYDMGRDIWNIPPANLDPAYRFENLNQIMYDVGMLFTKLSILTFYLSIFGIYKNFRYFTYFMITFVTSYLVAFLFVNIFQCSPEKKVWYPITTPGACLDGYQTLTALGVLNIVSDTVILLMPFPRLFKLRMSRSRMISIAAVFALGAFTVAASITRTVVVAETIAVPTDADQTWNIGPQINWLTIELLVGLLCAALISLPGSAKFFLNETRAGQSIRGLLSSRRTGSDTTLNRHKDSTSSPERGERTASASQDGDIELSDRETRKDSSVKDSGAEAVV